MEITTWILVIFGAIIIALFLYSTWYIISNLEKIKVLYHQIYAQKEAEARKYLKEKQGFDKI